MSAWPSARIEQCAEIVSGATPSTSETENWSGDIYWATPKDLSELEGAYLSDTPRKITKRGLESCGATILPTNSVLFSSRAPIGHVALNTVPMATNQGFKSFVPRPDRLNPKFLYHWLRKNRAYLESLGNGATFKEVSKAVVSRIEIPLPPLPEQRRIAEILDKADALRTKRRAALTRLDILIQSIFLHMFGDPATNPKGWKLNRLDETCEVGSSKRVFVEELVDAGVPFYRGTEIGQLGEGLHVNPSLFIKEEHFQTLKAQTGIPKLGDLLLPSICPDGRIYRVNDAKPFYFKDARVLWIKVDSSRIESVFLRHYLKHQFAANYSKIASGTTFAELKIVILKALEIAEAPLALQKRFAAVAEIVDRQRVLYRAQQSQLNNLFATLQSRAFAGEL